jgi:transposase
MQKHILAETHTLDELIEAKNKSSDLGQKLRLRAIINIKKGKLINQVSEDLLVSRRSISEWQNRYNDKGIEGLVSNKGGREEGNPKWDTKIFDSLAEMIKKTGGYWSIPKMQKWIKEKYKEMVPEQTIWYHLDILGFSYKSSRPHPYKGDLKRQESFKKTVLLRHWSV